MQPQLQLRSSLAHAAVQVTVSMQVLVPEGGEPQPVPSKQLLSASQLVVDSTQR